MKNQGDLFSVLRNDHYKLTKLIDEMQSATGSAEDEKKRLLLRFQVELQLHTELEEEVLYPSLQERESTRSFAIRAEKDHELVEVLLEDLVGISPLTIHWSEQLQVLKKNLHRHIAFEENEIFSKIREVFLPSELAYLTSNWLRLREENDAA